MKKTWLHCFYEDWEDVKKAFYTKHSKNALNNSGSRGGERK